MKIFNKVTIDVAERIVRFVADTGRPVQVGEPLVLIKPGERARVDSEPHL